MKFLKDYGLGVVLFLLFIGSWLGQLFFQWQEFINTQQEHNQPVEVNQFVPEFMSRTFENWQSEFLQLFSMVALTSFLIFKGSAESRDSQDEMMQKLTAIQEKLNKQGSQKKSTTRRR